MEYTLVIKHTELIMNPGGLSTLTLMDDLLGFGDVTHRLLL